MASLLEQLQADLSAAMKAGNDVEKSTLRMAIASVKNAAVAGDAAVTLTDDQVLGVLQAEAKKRSEAADIYKEAGRVDAEASERAELAILERYLPARLSDGELALPHSKDPVSANAHTCMPVQNAASERWCPRATSLARPGQCKCAHEHDRPKRRL